MLRDNAIIPLSNNDRTMGSFSLQDTSFIVESTVPLDPNVVDFCFETPPITLNFMRLYFKHLTCFKIAKFTDDWILSFLNGLNLISSDVPQQMYDSFVVFANIVEEQRKVMPSYSSMVRQQKLEVRY